MATLNKYQQQKQNQDQNQEQNQRKDKDKGKGGKPAAWQQNQVVYHAKVAWRFYTTLIKEGFLAAVFVAPFWAYFYYSGIKEVTIPTSFIALWAIGLMIFMLQSTMFRR